MSEETISIRKYLKESIELLANAVDLFENPFPPATQQQCKDVLRELKLAYKKLEFFQIYFDHYLNRSELLTDACGGMDDTDFPEMPLC